MARRVKLEFIANEPVRKATFKKRRRGLSKKINELSTLCGVEACAIIYSPNDPQPDVWPPWGVHSLLTTFMRMPALDQSRKMWNQESLLKLKIEKAKEQLRKQKQDNREKEMTHLMFQCLSTGTIPYNISMNDLSDLAKLIDQTLLGIDLRMKAQKSMAQMPQSQALVVAPSALVGPAKNKEKPQVDYGQGLGMKADAKRKQH